MGGTRRDLGTVASPDPVQDARKLVADILHGSVPAWHRFIDRYATLILSVVRRHLRGDEDEVRSVFVDVLEDLYRRSLITYQGRARLSTWLVLVTRNHTLDHLRKRLGRRELPTSISRLSGRDRVIFVVYHWEGGGLETVRERLRARGYEVTIHEILLALRRIETRLDHRTLRQLAYDAEAVSSGAMSGRLLALLDHLRWRQEEMHRERDPLQDMIAREAGERTHRLQALVAELPPEERQALDLRFNQARSANEISLAMGLGGQRQAFILIDRALRHVRRWFDPGKGDSGPTPRVGRRT